MPWDCHHDAMHFFAHYRRKRRLESSAGPSLRRKGVDHVDRRRFPGDLERFWKTAAGMDMSQWPYGRGPHAHLGGETDMQHGRIDKIRARAAASQQETMTPGLLGQGRDTHAGCGGPQGRGQVPHEPSSMTPIRRQCSPVTRYPSVYLGLVCLGLGGAAGRELSYCSVGSVASRLWCSDCVGAVTTRSSKQEARTPFPCLPSPCFTFTHTYSSKEPHSRPTTNRLSALRTCSTFPPACLLDRHPSHQAIPPRPCTLASLVHRSSKCEPLAQISYCSTLPTLPTLSFPSAHLLPILALALCVCEPLHCQNRTFPQPATSLRPHL